MATRTKDPEPVFDDMQPVQLREAWSTSVSSSKGADVVREMGLRAWAERVPELHGPMDFDRFRFQLPLYGHRATIDRELVVKKATQLGISAWALRWSLYWADVRGRTGLYVMPTEKVLKDFAQHRVKITIQRSEYLSLRIGAVNNVGLRQLGLGVVYFRGAAEAVNLESIPADTLVLDEYDSLEPANMGVAESRVSGPLSEGLIRRVGVPSVPGFGISKLYETTTKHQWMVKCSACGDWQPIIGSETYDANMDEARARLVCRVAECRRDLDVLHGEWVAERPEAETLGYWITKFIVPGIDLRRVVLNHHKKAAADVQSHFNRDLGEEYAPAEGRLSLKAIQACTRPRQIHLQSNYVGFNPVTMGIDVASARAFNVRISELLPHLGPTHKRALWVGTVEWEDTTDVERAVRTVMTRLGEMMRDFGVHMAAIDHLPENRISRAFTASFPGRAYMIAYDTSKPKAQMMTVDDDEALCVVHRTTALDHMIASFNEQRNLLPALEELPDDYADHLGALIRVVERDEFDAVKTYYRSTGPDDYGQAEVYDMMAGHLLARRHALSTIQAQQNELHPMRESDDPPEVDFDSERLEEPDYDGGEWQ